MQSVTIGAQHLDYEFVGDGPLIVLVNPHPDAARAAIDGRSACCGRNRVPPRRWWCRDASGGPWLPAQTKLGIGYATLIDDNTPSCLTAIGRLMHHISRPRYTW